MTMPAAGTNREVRMSAGSQSLLVLVTFLLVVVIPGFFLLAVPGRLSMNVVLMAALVLWASGRLVYTASTGKRRLTVMCFYVFVYVFFGVQPLMSAWTGRFPHRPFLTDTQMALTIALVSIGLIAFEIAYLLARRRSREDPSTPVPTRQRPVILSLLWIGLAVCSLLVMVTIAHYGPNIFLAVRGGGFVLDDVDRPTMSQTEGLLVISGLRGLLASFLFISLYLWRMRDHAAWPRPAIRQLLLLLAFFGVLNAVVSNPLSAPRLWSGSLVLTAFFIARPWKGARSYLIWSAVACMALAGLFSALDPRRIIAAPLVRGEPITIQGTTDVVVQSLQTLQVDANFDAFQMLGLISMYAEEHGYRLGHQMLLPAFFWIPRSVWPSKPLGTPDVVAASLNFFSINVGSPLWAEGYINFGVLGVVLLLAGFGYAARHADDYLVRTSRQPGELFPTIVCAFFAANTMILLRGDLTSGTMYLQIVFGLTFGILLLLKREARQSDGAGSASSVNQQGLPPPGPRGAR
jgi:hypothetical protein